MSCVVPYQNKGLNKCYLSMLLKTYFGLMRSKFRAKVGQKFMFLSCNVNKVLVLMNARISPQTKLISMSSSSFCVTITDNVEVSLYITKQNMTTMIYIFKNALGQCLKKATTMGS